MFRKRIALLLTALLLVSLPMMAAAAQPEEIGFDPETFSGEKTISGICITALEGELAGRLRLEERVLRPGDILTAEQVGRMLFTPGTGEADRTARLCYLPIYADGVGGEAVMTLSIRGREDKAPVAEDSALETYKNLSLEGRVKAEDPEGQPMTYTVTRQPKRGSVELRADGSFLYTPKRNKVGVDSFCFTATDPAGKVSREATVTVTILKASEARPYADTEGRDCRFAAEWMRNTGIFVGQQVDGNACFLPDREVTRGEFLAMTVKALELMEQETGSFTGFAGEVPQWLQPYAAAAVRAGLTAGLPDWESLDADRPITGAEAAVILQNALDMPGAAETAGEDVPAWAAYAVSALEGSGMAVTVDAPLIREEAALLLHQASRLTAE